MLGKNLREMQGPRLLTTTTKLTDAILENWTEERTVQRPSLKPCPGEEWREFWLYASSAHDWCPRLYALYTAFLRDGLDFGELLNADTLWNFGQGHVYHDLFQQKILPSLEGVLMGSWERFVRKPEFSRETVVREVSPGGSLREDGARVERGWGFRPQGDGWRYFESKIRFDRERVVVKLDGILAWPDAPHEVLEMKTEKLEARESLNPAMGGTPRVKHVIQANIGMWATGLTRARILYIFKGAPNLQLALLEHVIERDDNLIERIKARAFDCTCAVRGMEEHIDREWTKIVQPLAQPFADDDAKEKAMAAFKLGLWDAVPPRLDDCPMKSKGRAKNCAGRDLCFPAGYRKAEGK